MFRRLNRALLLEEGPLALTLPAAFRPDLTVGKLNGEGNTRASLRADKGTWRVTAYMLKPCLVEMTLRRPSGRAFGRVEDAWKRAESHPKEEMTWGPRL